jgi:glutathione S-transferase
VAAKLYVIPGSHPAMSARLMLAHKRIPYKRRDLMPVISHAVLKLLRFPGATVPGLQIEGRRLTGSRVISRELDRMYPEPPLFPADPDRRELVEEAEQWGDEGLQSAVRRLSWAAMTRAPRSMVTFAQGARLGVPTPMAALSSPIMARWGASFNKVSDEVAKADLAALPGMIDRVDRYIADGVIGGDEPNAADFQIAPSLRLLMCLDDIRPALEPRPAGELAMSLVSDFPGHVPPVLPQDWLTPLLGPAVATA